MQESNDSSSGTSPWKSVRKVRYKEDIYSAIRYAIKAEKLNYSQEEFRKEILAGRKKKFGMIQKHYRSVLYTPTAPGAEGTKLQVTLSDSTAFFKRLKLITIQKNHIAPTDFARRVYKALAEDRVEADLLLAGGVMSSDYYAYPAWLERLNEFGVFRIPPEFRGRNSNLRDYLFDSGFMTDPASFYAIRDLFYELELCNWMVDDSGTEHIYATSIMSESVGKGWEYVQRLESGSKIAMRRLVTKTDFLQALRRTYLGNTRERFGVEADLLSVRDQLCSSLGMSDQHCGDFLGKLASERQAGFYIRLNYGSVIKKRRNYGLKISTLPMVAPTRFAAFIRLDVAR